MTPPLGYNYPRFYGGASPPLLVGVVGYVYPGPVPDIGWWKFDEDYIDTVGGHNGTPVGSPSFVAGEIGQAVSLDGTDYVSVADATALRPAKFTVCAWINPNSSPAFASVVCKPYIPFNWTAPYLSYMLRVQSGQPVFSINDGSNYQELDSGSSAPLGVWTHLAGTYDGTNLNIYVNGTFTNNLGASGSPVYSTEPLKIGNDNGNGGLNGECFPGAIDDVRIYGRALSATEVAAVAGLYTGPIPDLGWWGLDEGTGTSTVDSSGSGNTGTLTNSPSWVTGLVAKALDFVGSSSEYVDIPNNGGLSSGLIPFSLSLFFLRHSTGDHGAFFKVGNATDSSGGDGFGVGIGGAGTSGFESSGNNLLFLCEGVAWVDTGATPRVGVWHSCIVTFGTGNFLNVYLDGASVFSGNRTIRNLGSIATPVITRIGGYESSTPTNRFFTGTIDDVRLYGRVLSGAEISAIAAE